MVLVRCLSVGLGKMLFWQILGHSDHSVHSDSTQSSAQDTTHCTWVGGCCFSSEHLLSTTLVCQGQSTTKCNQTWPALKTWQTYISWKHLTGAQTKRLNKRYSFCKLLLKIFQNFITFWGSSFFQKKYLTLTCPTKVRKDANNWFDFLKMI